MPTDALEINGALDFTDDERSPAGAVLVQTVSTVNPNVQPVQGVTNLSIAAFVPPAGSYYNYASFYNPPGTFVRLVPPNLGATTPMLETRPPIQVKFTGWGGSLNVDWRLSERLSLKSISGYREYDSFFSNDNDLSPLASSLGFGDLTFQSFSQELRLNGTAFTDDRLDYTVGAFYMDQRSVYATTQDLRYSTTGLTQFQGNDPVNADTMAFFGHLSFAHHRPPDDEPWRAPHRRAQGLHILAAHLRRRLHPALGAIDGVTSNYDGSKFDYRVNLQYDWNDSLMTYVQWATGFKGGGISPRPFSAAQAVPFDPEELESYELGVKSDLFDRTLRINASVFYSEYTDVQLTLASCPQYGVGLPCAVVANAGDAEVQGRGARGQLPAHCRAADRWLLQRAWISSTPASTRRLADRRDPPDPSSACARPTCPKPSGASGRSTSSASGTGVR